MPGPRQQAARAAAEARRLECAPRLKISHLTAMLEGGWRVIECSPIVW